MPLDVQALGARMQGHVPSWLRNKSVLLKRALLYRAGPALAFKL